MVYGFAEKALTGADGLADAVLTVVEFEPLRHVPPLQAMGVSVRVMLT